MRVPVEIKSMVKSLDTEEAWETFAYLLEQGKTTYRGLRLFGSDKTIRRLKQGGLIRKFVYDMENIDDEDFTYYEVTETGRKLMENLYKVFE